MSFPVPKQAAIVLFYNSKGEILLQDRRAKSKWGEEYGFFGGAVEPGETPEQALVREIDEELGIKKFDFKLFKIYNYVNSTRNVQIERNVYLADMPDISTLVCKDGKMEVRTFENSFGLKMITGFNELLQEIYQSLKLKGEIIN